MIWDGVVEADPSPANQWGGVRGRLTSPYYHAAVTVTIQPPHPGQRDSHGLWDRRLLKVGQRFRWHIGKGCDRVEFLA
jgi:hypothetical protein